MANCVSFCVYVAADLGVGPRILYIWNTHTTMEPHTYPISIACNTIKVSFFCMQLGLLINNWLRKPFKGFCVPCTIVKPSHLPGYKERFPFPMCRVDILQVWERVSLSAIHQCGLGLVAIFSCCPWDFNYESASSSLVHFVVGCLVNPVEYVEAYLHQQHCGAIIFQ